MEERGTRNIYQRRRKHGKLVGKWKRNKWNGGKREEEWEK